MGATLAILFLLLSFARSRAAASVEESARVEGEVVFYSSLNNEQIVTLRDAFQRKYPFLKVNFFRGTSERVMQRVITEAQAGRPMVDAVSTAGFQIQLLKEKGLTAKFAPAESAAYEAGFKDSEGHWTTLHILLNSMAYNTKLVSPADAAKRYNDLLHPKWKGKLGVNVRDPEWFVNLQRRLGKEKARELIRGLAAQAPGLQEAHNILAQLLTAGEFYIVSNTYAHIAAREKEKGAPIQWIFDEPVITYLHPVVMARHAPHPHAASFLISFFRKKAKPCCATREGSPLTAASMPKSFRSRRLSFFPATSGWRRNTTKPPRK